MGILKGLLLRLSASVAGLAFITACSNPAQFASTPSSSSNATQSSNVPGSGGSFGTPVPGAASLTNLPLVCDAQIIGENSQAGLSGTVYATTASHADNVADVINNGQAVASVYFSQFDIPTSGFNIGFIAVDGSIIQNGSGSALTQNFGVDVKGQLQLPSGSPAGYYQLAVISADGSIVNAGSGANLAVVSNDGVHVSQMGCASTVVTLAAGQQVPFEMQWFQGSEQYLALTLMWRQVPTPNADNNGDPLCGASGNSEFWDPTQSPPTPTTNYANLLLRGWAPVPSSAFALPSGQVDPCVLSPSPSPTPTASVSPSPSPSVSASPSPSPSVSVSPSPSPSVSASPSPSPSVSVSPSPSPSVSVSPSPSPSVSASPSPSHSPSPSPTPSPSTSSVVCDPKGAGVGAEYGLSGSLYSATAADAANVGTMIANGVKLNTTVYLNNLSQPTVYFTDGFTTTGGQKLLDQNGNVLIEYFALDMKSQLTLSDSDPEGNYELAILSDDGSIVNVDQGNGQKLTINNDGEHPTRMGCATQVLSMKHGQTYPIEIQYYQGPRYEIALTMMWRHVSGNSVPAESLCGATGNYEFWDPSQTPSAPTANYQQLLMDGWKVIGEQNFLLQAGTNPCNDNYKCKTYVELPKWHREGFDDNYINPDDTSFSSMRNQCQTKEDDNNVIIPPRDDKGTCYYVKMINKTPYQSSEDYKHMRTDIVARDHDGQTPFPRIMGTGSFAFTLGGKRLVHVGSDFTGQKSMYMDNFLLLEVASFRDFALLGYGTADSVPNNGPMTVNGLPVNFTSFAPGGTATVPFIHARRDAHIPIEEPVLFRATSLDCGVIGQTSDVYLVFK